MCSLTVMLGINQSLFLETFHAVTFAGTYILNVSARLMTDKISVLTAIYEGPTIPYI